MYRSIILRTAIEGPPSTACMSEYPCMSQTLKPCARKRACHSPLVVTRIWFKSIMRSERTVGDAPGELQGGLPSSSRMRERHDARFGVVIIRKPSGTSIRDNSPMKWSVSTMCSITSAAITTSNSLDEAGHLSDPIVQRRASIPRAAAAANAPSAPSKPTARLNPSARYSSVISPVKQPTSASGRPLRFRPEMVRLISSIFSRCQRDSSTSLGARSVKSERLRDIWASGRASGIGANHRISGGE